MSDERESGGGAGALIVVLLLGLLGVVAILGVGALFLFSVRSVRMESQAVEARQEAEMTRALAVESQMMAEGRAARAVAAEKSDLLVTINAVGEYAFAGEAKTADELELVLLQFARDNPSSSLAVHADKDAPLEPTVKLLEACKRVGIANFQFTTEGKP